MQPTFHFNAGLAVVQSILRANVDAGSLDSTSPAEGWAARMTATRGGRRFNAQMVPTRGDAELFFEIAIPDEPSELDVAGAHPISNDRVWTGDAAFDARLPSSSDVELARAILDAEVRAAFSPFLSQCDICVRPGKVSLRCWAQWAIGAGNAWMGACLAAAFLLADKVQAAIAAAQARAPSAAAWRASQAAALAVRHRAKRRLLIVLFDGLGVGVLLVLVSVLYAMMPASPRPRRDPDADESPTRRRPPAHPASAATTHSALSLSERRAFDEAPRSASRRARAPRRRPRAWFRTRRPCARAADRRGCRTERG